MSETPRERFVEAIAALIPWLLAVEANMGSILTDRLRHCCDAFADADCGVPYSQHPEYAHGGVTDTGAYWTRHHNSCRAALRKECGL